jgi:hypothetical protein
MSEYKHGQAAGTGVSDSRLVQLVQHSRTRLHDTHRAPQTLALWRDLNAVLEAEVDRRKRAVEVGAASGALQRKWAVERMAPGGTGDRVLASPESTHPPDRLRGLELRRRGLHDRNPAQSAWLGADTPGHWRGSARSTSLPLNACSPTSGKARSSFRAGTRGSSPTSRSTGATGRRGASAWKTSPSR